MRHFGVISPPVSGHIHPMAALARELCRRGHRVTWFHMQDLESKIRTEGLNFVTLGLSDHPPGSLPESLRKLAQLDGMAATRFTIQAVARTTEMFFREGPGALRETGIDALLVDQMEPAGGSLAEQLGLPFVTVCNALAINRDPDVPPPFTPWDYRSNGWLVRLRNRIGYAAGDRAAAPITRIVSRYRKKWKLAPLSSPDDSFSRLAQISQMPREFDFPRAALAANFYYVGPLREGSETTSFPWELLDGRRIVYASLGTLQNRREDVLRTIALACSGLDVQLVITHGGGLSADRASAIPGDPIVVPYAPQQAVLAKASLTVTHAGLNTVLDSLAAGVPMVTVPITYEQPAIARRVERSGAGTSIALRDLSPETLRKTIAQTLDSDSFRQSARRMAQCIASAGGTTRAADLVESSLNPGS